jgi:hemerythrin-like domain-containing protein
MLRDKNLIPLSRQHQHALALCVRINRAAMDTPIEVKAWQEEIQQHFEQEIQYHFGAEEAYLFPAARRYSELNLLVEELLGEHAQLRQYFSQATASKLDRSQLRQFAEMLSGHIRKEERMLFEGLQSQMTAEDLASLGAQLDRALEAVPAVCIAPTEAKLSQNS